MQVKHNKSVYIVDRVPSKENKMPNARTDLSLLWGYVPINPS